MRKQRSISVKVAVPLPSGVFFGPTTLKKSSGARIVATKKINLESVVI